MHLSIILLSHSFFHLSALSLHPYFFLSLILSLTLALNCLSYQSLWPLSLSSSHLFIHADMILSFLASIKYLFAKSFKCKVATWNALGNMEARNKQSARHSVICLGSQHRRGWQRNTGSLRPAWLHSKTCPKKERG